MRNFFLAFICAQYFVGCVMPGNFGTLRPPVGATRDRFNVDIKECMEWAGRYRDIPLSYEEQARLGAIETARFFEGGRGRNGFSDHYVLCLLGRGYQWVPDK